MRVVAVVSENPGRSESVLAARLSQQTQQAARFPVPLIRFGNDDVPPQPVTTDSLQLACHCVAELTVLLQQLRYAGAQRVFVDCQLPFGSVGEALVAAVDVLVASMATSRYGVDAITGMVDAVTRHARRLVFALGEGSASRNVGAACALALSRFAPVVPAGLLDTPTSAAELMQAIERLVSSRTGADCIQDWAATLERAGNRMSACEVVGVDGDSWRIRTAQPLAAGETLTLTLSMLGRFDAVERQPTKAGAVIDLRDHARRQHRLGERMAARVRTRLAALAAEASAAASTSVPVAAAANAAKRSAHPLLQRVVDTRARSEKINDFNAIVARQQRDSHRPPARIVVVGNEKGGSGKSTLAIHLVVSLLKESFDVATIDLDSRQASLTRYLDNRRAYVERSGTALPQPSSHTVIEGDADELRFSNMLMDLSRNRDFVVVDTPGHDQPLSRLAHLFADKVVTPINDSFLDLDVIARLDPDTADLVQPSHYGQVMQQARQERGGSNGLPDWIVVRNRLSSVLARNKIDMAAAVERLSQQMGFRVGPGLSERVIYRELFPFGLTLLDLREQGVGVSMTLSHVAARQELRAVLQLLMPDRLAQARSSQACANEREPATDTGDRKPNPVSAQVRTVVADTPRPVEHVDAG